MSESSIENVADLLFRDLQYLKGNSVLRGLDEGPGYRGVAEPDISSSVEQNLRMAIHAVKSGVVPASSELAMEARVAQVRFHQGLRIEDIMRGYRLSMAVIQDRFLDIAHEVGLGDREILVHQFGFLQREDIGLYCRQPVEHVRQAHAQRVDVPAGDPVRTCTHSTGNLLRARSIIFCVFHTAQAAMPR